MGLGRGQKSPLRVLAEKRHLSRPARLQQAALYFFRRYIFFEKITMCAFIPQTRLDTRIEDAFYMPEE